MSRSDQGSDPLGCCFLRCSVCARVWAAAAWPHAFFEDFKMINQALPKRSLTRIFLDTHHSASCFILLLAMAIGYGYLLVLTLPTSSVMISNQQARCSTARQEAKAAPSESVEPAGGNDLLTPTSLALSLSPPRAPPHHTPHRHLLTGLDPAHVLIDPSSRGQSSSSDVADADVHPHSYYTDHTVRSRLSALLPHAHLRMPRRLPHPHLPAGPELGDRITRALGSTLTLETQNALRDGGGFRRIVDGLVTMSVPSLAVTNPLAAKTFMKLTRKMITIRYGKHEMQKVELFMPRDSNSQCSGLLFFVHGGAWGSGKPWMYRLVAPPFLELNMAVAIVGYRTYPTADVRGQVEDLERAAATLYRERKGLFQERSKGKCDVCLMGHSSGAHISLLMLVDRIKRRHMNPKYSHRADDFDFTSYIGLSGPYDIGHHFDYEAGRGVEELSPMKPACGSTRHSFRQNSPASRLMSVLADVDETKTGSIGHFFPPILLLHGIEDSTVPFTATSEAGRLIRSCGVTMCHEAYIGGTSHQETVMEIMLGGPTKDAVLEWLSADDKKRRQSKNISMVDRSRL